MSTLGFGSLAAPAANVAEEGVVEEVGCCLERDSNFDLTSLVVIVGAVAALPRRFARGTENREIMLNIFA